MAISRASPSSRPLPLSEPLRREIIPWLFLKSWSDFLPWRSERHHQFLMYTNASSYAWGSVLDRSGVPLFASDYWTDEVVSSDIAVKEALALANALSPFADTIKNSRVDVFVDSSVLIHAWNKQAGRSHAFSDTLKAIFEALMATNCSLHLSRVPSAQNPADSTSRSLSLADSRLSDASWERLQVVFGCTNGHSVDLMALPSNDMFDFATAKLPFFSPHQALGCHGVNLFSQSPNLHPPLLSSNPYVFPPICVIANVPRFPFSVRVPFTIVVPDVQPRFWWPLLQHSSPSSLLIARKGEFGALRPPSKSGFLNLFSIVSVVLPIGSTSGCAHLCSRCLLPWVSISKWSGFLGFARCAGFRGLSFPPPGLFQLHALIFAP